MPASRDLSAAQYALGTLAAAEREAVERALGSDPTLRGLVEAWERRLDPLADLLPSLAPPEQLLGRIEARLAAEVPGRDGSLTVRASELGWETLMPGVERKRLYLSRREHREAVLIRLQPGAIFPSHAHGALEECLVLEGTIEVGGITVRAGDFHLAEPGTVHDDLRSPTGALLYVATAHAA